VTGWKSSRGLNQSADQTGNQIARTFLRRAAFKEMRLAERSTKYLVDGKKEGT
jgi:hypothetical protein